MEALKLFSNLVRLTTETKKRGFDNLEQMDDSALVEQIQKGDNGAFTVLMERWQARIHRFAFRFFADVDEASEITQKTFIKVYQKVDTLDEPGKFSSWIYRVANNLCLDELKRAGRRKSSPLEASTMSRLRRAGWVEQMEASQTPAKKLETKELGEVLQKALLTLPDEQRVVIILKEYEGMKFREIAEILEESENTVKSRMYYGLKSLRRVLKKWNIQIEYLNHD